MKAKIKNIEPKAQASGIKVLDPEVIRGDFPILSREVHGKNLIYFDNAATTQKPSSVIQAIGDYYLGYNANVHRGLHTLAEEATSAYEAARARVANFIGGVKSEEIIFTRNATEAINLVAYSWGRKHLGPGDRIVVTEMEHHANLVPWIALARKTGAELKYIPISDDGYLDLSYLDEIINCNTRIVAITQMSNVLGTINPVDAIIKLAHDRGALALVDAAQSAPHIPVNVLETQCGFFGVLGAQDAGTDRNRCFIRQRGNPPRDGAVSLRRRYDSGSTSGFRNMERSSLEIRGRDAEYC